MGFTDSGAWANGKTNHALRTHLNHIAGYCEILLDDARDLHVDLLDEPIARVRESVADLRARLVVSYDDPSSPSGTKEALSTPIYEMISVARDLRKRLAAQRTAHFLDDLGRLIDTAHTMLNTIDEAAYAASIPSPEGPFAPPPFPGPREAPNGPADRAIVLLVDDQALNRDMLAKNLKRQGHLVIEAGSAVEALDKLQNNNVDAVLLDVMMPGMNGYELLKHIKTSPSWKEIPVIMVSALAEQDLFARCLEQGADDYIAKPFDPIILKARVASSIERKRLREQERIHVAQILDSQRRLARELAEAGAYVRRLLPPFVESPPVRASWLFLPCAELGGDCFGYHWLDDNRFAMYLVDVSGHGVGAALLSVSLLSLLRRGGAAGADQTDPTSVLSALNRAFRSEDHGAMFATVWYGVFDQTRRSLVYAAAGAPPAVMVSTEDRKVERLGTAEAPMGIRDDAAFESRVADVPAEGCLYLFSDGAIEIRRHGGSRIGLDDFEQLLVAGESGPDRDLDRLLSQLRGLSVSETFEDDFSLVRFFFD